MKVLLISLATLFVAVWSSPTGTTSTTPATRAAVPTPIGSTAAPKSAKSVNSTVTSNPTSCAQHRQRESNSSTRLPGRVIPECTADGKYAALQCNGEAVGGERSCQCWDPEGNIVRASSKKTKACDCILQRHQMTSERPRRIGFIPVCDESGHFKKHQCHSSSGICWCVHANNGTQIGEKIRGLPAKSCV